MGWKRSAEACGLTLSEEVVRRTIWGKNDEEKPFYDKVLHERGWTIQADIANMRTEVLLRVAETSKEHKVEMEELTRNLEAKLEGVKSAVTRLGNHTS